MISNYRKKVFITDKEGSGKRNFLSFQPILTPPLSPMDCNNLDKQVKLIKSELDESRYENPSFIYSENVTDDKMMKHVGSDYEDLDSEDVTVNKVNETVNERETDHYEYLPDSLQLCKSDYDLIAAEKSLSFTSNKQIFPPKSRPISIVLYGDDMMRENELFEYRFDNVEVYGVSSVQMSPVMEQSLENSSSKTTLSSISYQPFNRLISSEDSCAKSPPSADISPSLDKLEISPDGHNFLFNELLWSNFNAAFDDYETFE